MGRRAAGWIRKQKGGKQAVKPKHEIPPSSSKTKRGNCFPRCPPPLLPSSRDKRAQRLPPVARSSRALWGSMRRGGVCSFRELARHPRSLNPLPLRAGLCRPAAPGVSHAGRYFGGRRGNKGERDERCQSQAHGKFLSRGKYFRRGFAMTAVVSFLHNPLYFGTKRRRRNSLSLPFSTAWRYQGADGFPTSPVPKLPVPTGCTVSSSCWKENYIYIYVFSDGASARQGSVDLFLSPTGPPRPGPRPLSPLWPTGAGLGTPSRPPVAFAGYAAFGDEMRGRLREGTGVIPGC